MSSSQQRKDHPRNPHQRAGTSLLEVLGTMSVLLVVAIAAVSMLGSVTQIGMEAKAADQARADIARLSQVLREDVQKCLAAVVDEDGQAIELISGPNVVRYHCDEVAGGIGRLESSDGKQVAMEWFAFTPRCRPMFSSKDRQVTLELTVNGAKNPWLIEVQRP